LKNNGKRSDNGSMQKQRIWRIEDSTWNNFRRNEGNSTQDRHEQEPPLEANEDYGHNTEPAAPSEQVHLQKKLISVLFPPTNHVRKSTKILYSWPRF